MIITNGLVFTEENTFKKKDLYIHNHQLVNSPSELTDSEKTNLLDANGLMILPGLIDLHIHGCAGYDFCDGSHEGLVTMAKHLKAHGITSFCPTTMTVSKQSLETICASINYIQSNEESKILGINMEGPFVSAKKKGAQSVEHIATADINLFDSLNSLSNNQVKLITIAPEEPNALSFIHQLHAANPDIIISLGHTVASYETAMIALESGASHITHLYNAMMPFSHREPGLIGAALDSYNTTVELICDGYHIHPSVIRATFTMFGAGRVILVSDNMRASGMSDGKYTLGGQDVYVKERKATLLDGTLAGSVTNLFDCMKRAISFGISVEDAINAATKNPAKKLGVYDSIGSIAIGKQADLLLVDSDFNLVKVL